MPKCQNPECLIGGKWTHGEQLKPNSAGDECPRCHIKFKEVKQVSSAKTAAQNDASDQLYMSAWKYYWRAGRLQLQNGKIPEIVNIKNQVRLSVGLDLYGKGKGKDRVIAESDKIWTAECVQHLNYIASQYLDVESALEFAGDFKPILQRMLNQKIFWSKTPHGKNLNEQDLNDALAAWKEKGRSIEYSIMVDPYSESGGGGYSVWLGRNQLVKGRSRTILALCHEFGHAAEVTILEKKLNRDFLRLFYSSYDGSPKSKEIFADCFGANLIAVLYTRNDAIKMSREGLYNEPADNEHPSGDARLNEISLYLKGR
jgi:hypothetical protein